MSNIIVIGSMEEGAQPLPGRKCIAVPTLDPTTIIVSDEMGDYPNHEYSQPRLLKPGESPSQWVVASDRYTMLYDINDCPDCPSGADWNVPGVNLWLSQPMNDIQAAFKTWRNSGGALWQSAQK
ncbi:MAG: hypothetical protein WCS37_21245 [Chloroflexota bacterium]